PARYSLTNKVVVISGGSRGLGLALAREFARHGAHIALLARDKEKLERAEADLLRFNAPLLGRLTTHVALIALGWFDQFPLMSFFLNLALSLFRRFKN